MYTGHLRVRIPVSGIVKVEGKHVDDIVDQVLVATARIFSFASENPIRATVSAVAMKFAYSLVNLCVVLSRVFWLALRPPVRASPLRKICYCRCTRWKERVSRLIDVRKASGMGTLEVIVCNRIRGINNLAARHSDRDLLDLHDVGKTGDSGLPQSPVPEPRERDCVN